MKTKSVHSHAYTTVEAHAFSFILFFSLSHTSACPSQAPAPERRLVAAKGRRIEAVWIAEKQTVRAREANQSLHARWQNKGAALTQTLRRKRERGREASGLGSEDEVSVMREVVWKAMGKGFIYKNARRHTKKVRRAC